MNKIIEESGPLYWHSPADLLWIPEDLDTVRLCTKYKDDWIIETDVMVERDFVWFEFKMSFRKCSWTGFVTEITFCKYCWPHLPGATELISMGSRLLLVRGIRTSHVVNTMGRITRNDKINIIEPVSIYGVYLIKKDWNAAKVICQKS